jgi:hypothetical protein
VSPILNAYFRWVKANARGRFVNPKWTHLLMSRPSGRHLSHSAIEVGKLVVQRAVPG